MKKGLIEWLKSENPDIFCLQEVKALQEQVDLSEFEELGYHVYWQSAEKKGYSGVATFTKFEPVNVVNGWNHFEGDYEGRLLRTDYKDFSLLNVYIPSGTSGDIRQDLKMEWLERFSEFVKGLLVEQPNLIICGDFNIAHKPIDIHNPISNKNSSGFLPEEREWLTNFIDNNFIDTFRHFNNDPHHYTWWTYRANARNNNKGWRIDYIMASNGLKNRLFGAKINSDAVHSDHCPSHLIFK